MTGRRIPPACLLLVLCSFSMSLSQARSGRADTGMVGRVWEEGIGRSRIMETLGCLTDVIGHAAMSDERLPRKPLPIPVEMP